MQEGGKRVCLLGIDQTLVEIHHQLKSKSGTGDQCGASEREQEEISVGRAEKRSKDK